MSGSVSPSAGDAPVSSPCAPSTTAPRRGELLAPCCGLSRSRPTPHKKSHHLQTIPEASQEKHQDRPAPSSRAISIPDGRFRFFSLAWRRWLPRNALTNQPWPALAGAPHGAMRCGEGDRTRRHGQARQSGGAKANCSNLANRPLGGRGEETEESHRQAVPWEREVWNGDGDGTPAVWLSKVARQSKREHATGSLTSLACQIGDPFILLLPFLSFSPCGLWLGPWVPCTLSGQGCLLLGTPFWAAPARQKRAQHTLFGKVPWRKVASRAPRAVSRRLVQFPLQLETLWRAAQPSLRAVWFVAGSWRPNQRGAFAPLEVWVAASRPGETGVS